VIHERQRLSFGFEAGDDLAGIHPQLDDLESHFAADGLLLLGRVDHRHAPFADLLQELVPPNHCPRTFRDGCFIQGGVLANRRSLQKITDRLIGVEK